MSIYYQSSRSRCCDDSLNSGSKYRSGPKATIGLRDFSVHRYSHIELFVIKGSINQRLEDARLACVDKQERSKIYPLLNRFRKDNDVIDMPLEFRIKLSPAGY